eukprot:TRINITY_DN53812_c0_g2_i1.p1 TRINITY_DN53812_c0_g2~~TRINITY_DN53812_c0_g2_i1.p1  ORF type:complete len:130 (+),score=0.99 TRINITY_DN53812_c0_g2_i1:23-391(+)
MNMIASTVLFIPIALRLLFLLTPNLSRSGRHAWLLDTFAAIVCSVGLFGAWYLQTEALYSESWPLQVGVFLFEVLAVLILYRHDIEQAFATTEGTPKCTGERPHEDVNPVEEMQSECSTASI